MDSDIRLLEALDLVWEAVKDGTRYDIQSDGTWKRIPPGEDRRMEAVFRHGPLSGEAECDEWIATTIRKLPRGALAKLYRVLYEGEGLRIDSAKQEEAKWVKSLKS